MDLQEKLAHDAKFLCAVLLGKDEAGGQHLHLIVVGSRLSDEYSALLIRHRAEYVGVIGIMPGGFVDAEPVDHTPETVHAMTAAVPAFFEVLAAQGRLAGDSVDWLTRLHSLEDPRTAQPDLNVN